MQGIKKFSKRGSDIKILEYGEIYSTARSENDPEYLIIPKAKGLSLSETLSSDDNSEANYISAQEAIARSTDGVIYVSGYQVEEDTRAEKT